MSVALLPNGREQVMGLHLPGDLLGLDGLGLHEHTCSLVALEDAEVCVVLRGDMEALLRRFPPLQSNVHALMSREVIRARGASLLLGSLTAEERVAVFVASLSRRLLARGLSDTELVLRMTRAEIGSYLGLTLETVSRMLSRMSADGILAVDRQTVRILDEVRLNALARPTESSSLRGLL